MLDIKFLATIDPKGDTVDSPLIDRQRGKLAADANLIGIDEWEKKHRRKLKPEDAEELASKIAWIYAKWMDLQYDLCQSLRQ